METKYCKRCNVYKSIDCFGNDRRFRDGKRFYCKDCNNADYNKWYYKDPQYAREVSAIWRQKNPSKRKQLIEDYKDFDRNNKLRATYGITLDQYNDMLAAQQNVCAVCGQPNLQQDKRTGTLRRLHVDHNHQTNIVRGLLCYYCNTALGLVQDSKEHLYALIDYLERTDG